MKNGMNCNSMNNIELIHLIEIRIEPYNEE